MNQSAEQLSVIDPRKFHVAELERLHAILSAVSFGGILELAGGAPKESRAIQIAVARFVGIMLRMLRRRHCAMTSKPVYFPVQTCLLNQSAS
jgi:hypothetical protein